MKAFYANHNRVRWKKGEREVTSDLVACDSQLCLKPKANEIMIKQVKKLNWQLECFRFLQLMASASRKLLPNCSLLLVENLKPEALCRQISASLNEDIVPEDGYHTLPNISLHSLRALTFLFNFVFLLCVCFFIFLYLFLLQPPPHWLQPPVDSQKSLGCLIEFREQFVQQVETRHNPVPTDCLSNCLFSIN